MQHHQLLEVIRELLAALGLTACERIFRAERVRQVIGIRQVTKQLSVRTDTAETGAGEINLKDSVNISVWSVPRSGLTLQ